MDQIAYNLIKLQFDLNKIIKSDSKLEQINYNYVTATNNIISLLYENENINNGNVEEVLQESDIEYIREIFSNNCFTFKEQNNYIKNHDITNEQSREELIKGCLWIPVVLSLNYIDYDISFMDLLSQGIIGLIEAINNYGDKNAKSFSILVKDEVMKVLKEYVKVNGKYGYIKSNTFNICHNLDTYKDLFLMIEEHECKCEELSDFFNYPLDSMKKLLILGKGTLDLDSIEINLDDNNVINPEDEAINNVYIEELINICKSVLNNEEQFIFFSHCGINCYTSLTQKEIGIVLGYSEQTISYNYKRCIKKIRKSLLVLERKVRDRDLLSIDDVKNLRKIR